MRNLKHGLIVAFSLLFIVSCNNENTPQIKLEKEAISSKWIVNGASDYKSIEFNNDGSYIVVNGLASDENVYFGNYKIVNNTTISLSDFGTIEVSEISDNSINFKIQQISSSDETIIKASKQETIVNSNNTELLCRTWKAISIDNEAMDNFIVLFSNAGTYLVDAIIEGDPVTALGTWTWCNSEENKLAFTIENELNCDGIEIFKDIQLTSNSFIGIDMENGKPQTFIMEVLVSN